MTESLRNTSVGEVLGKASLLAVFGVFATFKAIAVKSQFMSLEPTQGIESHIELAAQIASLVFLYQIPMIRTRGPIGAVRWT
jgi:hypothetical protein